ncbi:dynein regulatory complex subunit 2-like [Neoarius graeffei]|uniref:dynein regulatory complex subunit 2-like n=1 Tax=Neoarius graeffei TaxID=443677 RepID=UPI00298C717A|nr:dynein regulatory complex subunit 2-like [Neoarius graeffei]
MIFFVLITADTVKEIHVMDNTVNQPKVHHDKLNQQWRAILRQTRAAELREDFTILRKTFERVVACKDNAINLLVRDLNETAQQSSAHLQHMDHLLKVQKSRLAALESHWSTSLKELSTEYNSKRDQLLKLHQQESEYIKAESFALGQRYAEMSSEAKQDYLIARDDIKNRHAVDSTLQELQQWYLREMQACTEATEDQKNKALNLHSDIEKINLKRRQVQKLQDTIKAPSSHQSSSQSENEAYACHLQEQREELTQKVQQLRAKLSSAQEAERTRLVNQITYSNNTIKKLQDVIGEEERLLRMADVCRKLETEQEKMLPFYMSSLNAEELSQEKAHSMEAMSKELAQTMVDYRDLEKFWQRYNKILLERLCLEREKVVLGRENQQLRILLKQYLDRISVSDEILQQQNSLLMLSCAPQLVSPASKPQTCRTVIEAAHVVQHTL